jgi:hypothetical protein
MNQVSNRVYFHWNPYYFSSSITWFYKKLILLIIIIGVYTFLTRGHFLLELTEFFGLGLFLLVALSSPVRPFKTKSPHLFFMALLYCLFPYYTPDYIYLISVIILVLVIEYLFKTEGGYFFNPSLIIWAFCTLMIFDTFYFSDKALLEFLTHFFSTQQVQISTLTTFSVDQIVDILLGFNIVSPSQVGGILVFVYFLFFKKERKIIFLNSVYYLFGVFLFLALGIFFISVSHGVLIKLDLMKLFINVFHSSLFFSAIFLVSESLGSAPCLSEKKRGILLSALFTALFYFFSIYYIAPFLGILLGQLVGQIFSYLSVNHRKETLL